MDRTIKFFLPMKEPPSVTAQMHRVKKTNQNIFFYDSPEMKAVKTKFMGLLLPYRPEIPLVGPIQLVTKWIWPANNKHKVGEYKTTRPDTDNLIKAFKDCMTQVGYWNDDAQVASEITQKFWGDVPGIYVEVSSLDNSR